MDADKLFPILECINTYAGGLMAGFALYINIVEHPARMAVEEPKAIHRQWMASFDAAATSMVGLSVIPIGATAAMYYLKPSRALPWVGSTGLTLVNIPWTLFVLFPNYITPIYDKDVCSKKDPAWVVRTVEGWNKHHMFRTAVNMASFALCIYNMAYNH